MPQKLVILTKERGHTRYQKDNEAKWWLPREVWASNFQVGAIAAHRIIPSPSTA